LAALSGRDVASVEMIESTVEDGLASTDLGLGADKIPGGADNTSARDRKTEARRSKTATRRSAMDCQRTKRIGAQDETTTRRVEIMHPTGRMNARRGNMIPARAGIAARRRKNLSRRRTALSALRVHGLVHPGRDCLA
jgi:hypothetical protein